MKKPRVLIIGAGASGMLAAIMAAREGGSVTLLEQNDRPGKKICATGNGKCNLTNLYTPANAYRGSDPSFVSAALKAFSVEAVLDFFQELGIFITERQGYVYPRSGQAHSVVEVLLMELRRLGVKIKTREQVQNIKWQETEKQWQVLTQGWHYEGEAVILAGGSKASNISGSDGSCYALAQSLGHSLIKPLPALTALKCGSIKCSRWAGIRIHGSLSLFIEGEHTPYMQEGELQLTDYGISGIPVFQLSRYAIRALERGKTVRGTLDFLPECSREETFCLLKDRLSKAAYKSDKEQLVGLFPDKLIGLLTDFAKKSASFQTSVYPERLTEAVKAFPISITAGLSFAQAQVCSGGVSTEEVWAHTMASRLHRGIYFAGELLDIDGSCGGYNLQWAWSSGAVAGKHAVLDFTSQREDSL